MAVAVGLAFDQGAERPALGLTYWKPCQSRFLPQGTPSTAPVLVAPTRP